MDEDDLYFIECEVASMLRTFKAMGQERQVYEAVSRIMVKPQIDQAVRKAYEAR